MCPSDLDDLVQVTTTTEDEELLETRQTLRAAAQRRCGSIPVELLVEKVISATREADWPVRREAMEALLRRTSFARRDELRVTSRPPRGAPFGVYRTGSKGAAERPYRTVLRLLDPLSGSCDCPDFLRSSLGMCKHLLAVAEHLFAKPLRRRRALAAQEESRPRGERLEWNPVRPFTGPGDWIERVRWLGDGDGKGHGSDPGNATIRRWFRSDGAGGWSLRSAHPDDSRTRLRLVTDLIGLAVRRGRKTPWQDEPALIALLRAEESRLRRLDDASLEDRALAKHLRSLKQRLYPYQIEGVTRFFHTHRLLLADDMGLGKTAQAIACCHVLWGSGQARRGLVLVPASLKAQWLREWQLFSDVPIYAIDGSPSERRSILRSRNEGFLVANYEQLLRDLEPMYRWNPEVVVLDEAQRIKNWATKTALYVKKLQPPFRLVLTGTPMENRIDELASVMDWVDDHALEPKWRLTPWHATVVDGKQEIAGARNLDTLRSRLVGSMVRRVRRDVLDQLPPRTDTIVPVEPSPEQMDEHANLDQPIASILGRAGKRPLTQAEFLRLMGLLTTQRIICNGLAQLQFEHVWPALSRMSKPGKTMLEKLSSPKLGEFRELIEQIVVRQERKVVVFSQWLRMLRLAHWSVGDLLASSGVRALFFTGEERQRRRTQNLVEFHDEPDARILFASDAGGVGLNLQRAANCCINLELPWNPAVLEQRIGRIYRLGQKAPIDVYNLVSSQGIESRIAGIVENKKAFFTGLFDGTSNEVRFESSGTFLSRIAKLVDPVPIPDLQPSDGDADADAAMVEGAQVDELLAQADESGEVPVVATITDDGSRPPSGPDVRAEAPTASEVGDLFSRLDVQRTSSGGIRIEAPPEAASALAALFGGMARLLENASKRAPED